MAVVSASGATATASTGTTITPSYPAAPLAGDLFVLTVALKPATANGGGVTTPAGWTLQAVNLNRGGYDTTIGADVGNMGMWMFTKTAVGGETGTVTVTLTDNNIAWAQITWYRNGTHGWGVYTVSGGQDATGTNTLTIAGDGTVPVVAGDYVHWAFAIPTDLTTPTLFTDTTVTIPGVTSGATVEYSEPDTSSGNDAGGVIGWTPIVAGSATGPLTFTATVAGDPVNVRGPYLALILHQVDVGPSVNKLSDIHVTAMQGAGTSSHLLADIDMTAVQQLAVPSNQRLADIDITFVQHLPAPPLQKISDIHYIYATTPALPGGNVDVVPVSVGSTSTDAGVAAVAVTVGSTGGGAGVPSLRVTVGAEVNRFASVNDVWIWDGSMANPANVFIWDGSTAVPGSVSTV